jgi:hypothetical protein
MKKLYTFAMLLLIGIASHAQITSTTYRGAFEPAPAAQWTDGWANFDPQNTVYPLPTASNVVQVNANITSNTTWVSTNVYYLKEQIYVKNNATLTIQPGTTVLVEKRPPPSTGVPASPRGLIVTKGSKLIANGTATQPIVFTSDQSTGNRAAGDWGGIVVLGKGSLNVNNGVNFIEGIAQGPDTEFGGGATPDDNDNSGTLQYVRIEFAGYVYSTNNELNGLTMGAVGRGTTIDFVQTSFTNDDGFEWFGGAVNCAHLVSYRNVDDDFDTDNGFSGKVQFGLIVRDPRLSDISSSNGFESDNNNNSGGSFAGVPFTTAVFSNVTVIGPYFRATLPNNGNPVLTNFGRAAHLRRNTRQGIFNSIFMDYNNGLHIDHITTETNALNNDLRFKNNIVVAATPTGRVAYVNTSGNNASFNVATWYAANSNTTIASNADLLTKAYDLASALIYTGLDYRPSTNSPAASGASFTDSLLLSSESFTNNFASSVYPNPYSDSFKIQFASLSSDDVQITSYDITGRQIESKSMNASDINNIELGNNYNTGIYLVVLKQAGNSKTFKVVKK